METPLGAKPALLQALAVPGYGLDLIERIERASRGLVQLGPGSVYPALRALERERLVRVRRVAEAGPRGRPRRYYELTLEGVQVAMAQRAGLLELFGGLGVPALAADVDEMRRRMESCSALSGSVLELQRRLQAVISQQA